MSNNTKYVTLEIPTETQGFAITFLYIGADGMQHLCSRDYAIKDDNVYDLPHADSMALHKEA